MIEIPYLAVMGGGVTTLALCLLLVLTKGWHGRFTLDGTTGVQKFHVDPTPRVGGLGFMAGLGVAWTQSPAPVAQLLGPMLLAGLPAFVFGIAEDLSKRVGVRERLLATMASGVLAWWLTGVSLTRVDVWGLDHLLDWLPLSIAFTAFAVGGVANAVNIIDGFNGLASGTLLICFAALGLIAYQAGDPVLATLCLVLGGVTASFLLVNFPLGKIFLGDGGAYFIGFLLAWVAVMLPMRNPSVSPWASLLACGYPVLEVLFSMARRYKRSCPPGQPDRLHLHSLIKSRLIRKRLAHWSPVLRNAAVSPLAWLYALLPAGLAVLFATRIPWLIASFVVSTLVYLLCYWRLIHFRWKFFSALFPRSSP